MKILIIIPAMIILIVLSTLRNTSSSPSSDRSAPYFVTDFDGTLAHYENLSADTIALPASSGSGKIAHISPTIVKLLEEISSRVKILDTAMICASGQRVSTMQQRQSYLPVFDYWISENGGRIHRGR